LNGEEYYWSKRNVDHPHFKDFMSADRNCYWPYDQDNIHDYSTHLFRDKAVQTIEEHDATNPLFLFLSFQAVHDPFTDVNGVHSKGIPKEYVSDSIYNQIKSNVQVKQVDAMLCLLSSPACRLILSTNPYRERSVNNMRCH
jgi:hypothetical protein